MPNEIADQNSVDWGSGEFGGIAGSLFGPTTDRLLGTGAEKLDAGRRKKKEKIWFKN